MSIVVEEERADAKIDYERSWPTVPSTPEAKASHLEWVKQHNARFGIRDVEVGLIQENIIFSRLPLTPSKPVPVPELPKPL